MNRKERGKWGEILAAEFLSEKGYSIEARNWRWSHAEIDLIAMWEESLVFIEVKTRSLDAMQSSGESLSAAQLERIVLAAAEYMQSIDYDWTFRIDLICIDFYDREHYKIRHIEDLDIGTEFV